ncbi:MAG: S53 family peptidase [Acidobacteriota bacterium]
MTIIRRILSTTILAAAALPLTAQITTATQGISLAQLVSAGDSGPLPSSTPLTVRLGLNIQNKSALEAYVKSVNDPSSPIYGQFLTPAQFTAQYAPSATQVQQAVSFLQSAGFTNITVEPNNLIVSADATAAVASSAFHTPLEQYTQFGQLVYGNTLAPQIPAALQNVVGAVLGLNTIGRMHTNLATPSAPQYLVSYNPKDFLQIYNGSTTAPASNIKIAIMAEGDVSGVITDLRAAENLFGLPQVPVEVRQVGLPSPDVAGLDEWDMDTQYSTGMAGTVKKLYIYTTTSLSDSDLALEISKWASDNVAQAASASLGICEFFPFLDGSMLVDDNSFLEAAAQGQTFFASSGDTGSFCPVGVGTNGVPAGVPFAQYPAASTYVIGVGGTTLLTNGGASGPSPYTYNTETSWYAGGGGLSQFEGSSYWQMAAFLPSAQGNLRAVPDVSYDADPESGANVVVNGTAEGVGGTSLSSPMMLGTWARVLQVNKKIGFAGPALYSLYQPTSATNLTLSNYPNGGFHDIILGANGFYPTTPGFDLNTGLGTPNILQLTTDLAKRK